MEDKSLFIHENVGKCIITITQNKYYLVLVDKKKLGFFFLFQPNAIELTLYPDFPVAGVWEVIKEDPCVANLTTL